MSAAGAAGRPLLGQILKARGAVREGDELVQRFQLNLLLRSA